MASLIKLLDTHTHEELATVLRTSHDEGQKTRIKIIMHVQKGLYRRDIAEKLSVNLDTITDTVKKYNNGGIPALTTHKGGRPPGNLKWNQDWFDALARHIKETKEYWSLPKMSEWIKANYTAEIPENTIWYHITSLNLSYKSARPHPQKGNKDAQEAFKKGGSKKNSQSSVRNLLSISTMK